MPNGGSDCCGTCWFNQKNEGKPGYPARDNRQPNYCTIRETPIENPFYTYCSNHPHHRPEQDSVPIGPIWQAVPGRGLGYSREVWLASPDNEEIRQHLLNLLSEISSEGDGGIYSLLHPETATSMTVVRQIGEFREQRAIPNLERLRDNLAGRPLGNAAEEALRQIREDG